METADRTALPPAKDVRDLLEGLLVKKAGLTDAVGLVDGLYPGAAAAGFRNFPESTEIKAPRIGEVYTKGTLTLGRLGREAPIAAGNPAGRLQAGTTTRLGEAIKGTSDDLFDSNSQAGPYAKTPGLPDLTRGA